MGGRNLSRQPLRREQLTKLAPGEAVVNGDMDIFVKRADDRWEGEHARPTTTTLLAHPPVRRWPYAVPVGLRGTAGVR